MELVVTEIGSNVTCVHLAGRLDAPGADQIDLRFTAAVVTAGRDVLVDLSGVSFVASMGIRLLIAAARGLAVKGRRLVMYGAQPLVQDVFEQAAIDQLIPMAPTQAEALALLQAG